MKTLEEALVALESRLGQKRLTSLQKQILQGAWNNKSYGEIAAEAGYHPEHVKKMGYKLWQLLSNCLGEPINKKNLLAVLQAQDSPGRTFVPLRVNRHHDWGEAPDVSAFVGRESELAQLQEWALAADCRLLAITGIGGIGKTVLAAKLAAQVQHQFEFIIWRSLHNAPTLEQILLDWLRLFALGQAIDLNATLETKLATLMHFLQNHHCLLILDNCESILAGGNFRGDYREGYQGYGELLRRIGTEIHQSCLMVTGRELPSGLTRLDKGPFRSLSLKGLDLQDWHTMLRRLGLSRAADLGSEQLSDQLLERYDGNPLSLNIVAATIQERFGGNVALFLEQTPALFGDIYDLLTQQFNRLSDLEKQVMYWLAINREWLPLPQLGDDLYPQMPQRPVLEALLSLQRRSLIEANTGQFTLQPVVMEYVTEQILEQTEQEILSGELLLLNRLALMKAQISDYIRESQIRVILAPLAAQLRVSYKPVNSLSTRFQQLLKQLQNGGLAGYAAGNLLNLLHYLELDLTGYDLSNLTIWQAYLQDVNLHQVNLRGANLEHSVFTSMLAPTQGLTFSPDGNWLATANGLGEVLVFQVKTGQKLLSFSSPGWSNAVTFSPNGQYLASSHSDGSIKVWDLVTQTCWRTLPGPGLSLREVFFSPDSQTLLTGNTLGEVKLWDLPKGTYQQLVTVPDQFVMFMALSPDGKTVATGGGDAKIHIWDLETGDRLQTLAGHTEQIWAFAFAPSPLHSGETIIISTSHDRTIRFWNLTTGECWRVIEGHSQSIVYMVLSPGEQVFATASTDYTIKLWDCRTGELLKTLQGHQGGVHTLDFSPDGRILASCALDGTIKLWDTALLTSVSPSELTLSGHLGQCLRTSACYTTAVWSVAFSPDGQRLASGTTDGLIRLWDVPSGDILQSLAGHTSYPWSISFAPNPDNLTQRTMLASASLDGLQYLWNLETGESQLLSAGWHFYTVVAFSPDGHWLAIRRAEDSIGVWDGRTGEFCHSLSTALDTNCALSFSPDGRFLAGNGAEATVYLWQVSTWECQRVLRGNNSLINALAFHPQEQQLATGSSDGTVKLWDIDTGECLTTLTGHQNQVWSLAFLPLDPLSQSPRTQLLASAGDDNTIKLWNLATGDCLQTLTGHKAEIRSLAFSPDGKHLASGSLDETIRLWDTQTWECQRILRAPRPYEGMDITGVTGLTEVQKVTLKRLGAIEDGSGQQLSLEGQP